MVTAKQNGSGIAFVIATFLNDGAPKLKKLKTGVPRSLVENLTEDDRAELRAVVDVWLDAKGDWAKFSTAMLQQFGAGAMNPYTNLKAHRMANGAIVIHAAEKVTPAQELMLELLHPDAEAWRLAGRCENCGRYMVRKTKRKMKYCDKDCNNARHILAAKSEVRERKTEHIIAASARYKPGGKTWREFVLEKANEAWQRDLDKPKWASISDNNKITPTFLTRCGVKEPTN